MKKEEKLKIKLLTTQLENDFYDVIRSLDLPDTEILLLLEAFSFYVSPKYDTYEHRAKRLYQHHYIAMGILCAYNEIL